jgi:hypothetical protein
VFTGGLSFRSLFSTCASHLLPDALKYMNLNQSWEAGKEKNEKKMF